MGIKNLFANLPSLSRKKQLSEFAGARVGIDGNFWMFQAYHSQFNSDYSQNVNGIIRLFDSRLKLLEKHGLQVL